MEESAKYLVETEHAELHVLAHFHHYIDNFSEFLGSFGIASRHAWYLIELPTERLVSGVRGEVDILTGNLDPADPLQFDEILSDYRKRNPEGHPQHHYNYPAMSLALNGGLKWPPS